MNSLHDLSKNFQNITIILVNICYLMSNEAHGLVNRPSAIVK